MRLEERLISRSASISLSSICSLSAFVKKGKASLENSVRIYSIYISFAHWQGKKGTTIAQHFEPVIQTNVKAKHLKAGLNNLVN